MSRLTTRSITFLSLVWSCCLLACSDDSTPATPDRSPTADLAPDSGARKESSVAGESGPDLAAAGPFSRYVSLGGSLAAGVQSHGIHRDTQLKAFPVVLAGGAQSSFAVPLIALPGCPAPISSPYAKPAPTGTCKLDATSPPASAAQNLAVPGARLGDAVAAPAGSLLQIQTLLLGARSQTEAMQQADPSFVTVSLGDEDAAEAALSGVLGPKTSGGVDTLTSLGAFTTSHAAVVVALKSLPKLQGALLVGVVDPIVALPLLQPGAFYFLSRDAAGKFYDKPVNSNCSPVTGLGQPNPLASNLISGRIVADSAHAEINCDPSVQAASPYLLTAQETVTLRTRVTQYNQAIQAAAQSNGWAYFDPNPFLAAQVAKQDAQGRFQAIRKCQLLATATTAATFQAAVLNSCPVTGPTAAPSFFGSLFSLDGATPSAEGQALLAGKLADAINQKYKTQLPTSY